MALSWPPLFGSDGLLSTARLSGFFLLSVRVAVVLAMTPVLYAMPVPTRIRFALVLVLSGALAAGLPPSSSIAIGPVDAGHWIQAALKEVALGATLALGITIAFAAFAVAGNLLDVQIGFGIAQVFDPVSNRASPLLVSAFNYAAVIVFFLVDGHHALLRGLAYSFEVFPVGAAWSITFAITPVLKQVGGLFSLGFALAAPVVFCILLVELALGVISRNLPQVNMLALGIPIKIVVGLVTLAVWAAAMGPVMNRIYANIYQTWTEIFIQAKASARSDALPPLAPHLQKRP